MTEAAGTRAASDPAADRWRVFVRDLVLPCRIGVHSHELRGHQRVRINIDVDVTACATVLDDRLSNAVDYERLVSRTREVVAARHYNLAETLAERIADLCLADPRAASARVRVEKLDIFSDTASVGVELVRSRP
jgi:7,8-dihydroneopterin aldolase/epimerase/oxygenase